MNKGQKNTNKQQSFNLSVSTFKLRKKVTLAAQKNSPTAFRTHKVRSRQRTPCSHVPLISGKYSRFFLPRTLSQNYWQHQVSLSICCSPNSTGEGDASQSPHHREHPFPKGFLVAIHIICLGKMKPFFLPLHKKGRESTP